MEANNLTEIREWITDNQLTMLVFTTPDLEATPEIAGQYGVFAVPVYILSVQGREAIRFARYFGIDEMEGAVERYSSLLQDS